MHNGGTFYYPARIILWDKTQQTATVEMWRGIENGDIAGKILEGVAGHQIVDGLYKDKDGRRQVQVSNV